MKGCCFFAENNIWSMWVLRCASFPPTQTWAHPILDAHYNFELWKWCCFLLFMLICRWSLLQSSYASLAFVFDRGGSVQCCARVELQDRVEIYRRVKTIDTHERRQRSWSCSHTFCPSYEWLHGQWSFQRSYTWSVGQRFRGGYTPLFLNENTKALQCT